MKIKTIPCMLAAVAAFAFAGSADATGVGGWVGVGNTSPICLGETWGALEAFTGSGCTSGYSDLPLPVSAGTYNPTVGMGWPSGSSASSYVQCASVTVAQTGTTSYDFSGYAYPSGTSGKGTVQPGSVTVPSNGFMYESCWLYQGGIVYSVNY
jgi:hypothetical protein